jgi:hypothetical protein
MSGDFTLRGTVQGTTVTGTVPVRVTNDGSLSAAPRVQELAMRGRVYSASVVAQTLPVNAATLASKCGLYNPPSSGYMLELLDISAHYVVATTVVNGIAIYYSNGTNATGATFTTAGVIENGRLGEGPTPAARFYSAVTHVGTPLLVDIFGGWGAVTDGGSTLCFKDYSNKGLLIPPTTLIAVAMTTAAATGSGVSITLRWAEIPYQLV